MAGNTKVSTTEALFSALLGLIPMQRVELGLIEALVAALKRDTVPEQLTLVLHFDGNKRHQCQRLLQQWRREYSPAAKIGVIRRAVKEGSELLVRAKKTRRKVHKHISSSIQNRK